MLFVNQIVVARHLLLVCQPLSQEAFSLIIVDEIKLNILDASYNNKPIKSYKKMSEQPQVPTAVLKEVLEKEKQFEATIEAKKQTKEKLQGTVLDELKEKEKEFEANQEAKKQTKELLQGSVLDELKEKEKQFEATVEAKKQTKEKLQGSVLDELIQKEKEFEANQEAKKETGEKKKTLQDELLNANVQLKHVETKETHVPLNSEQ